MNDLHTPLALTDFSTSSHHAIQRAAMLAKLSDCRLELLHVMEKNALSELQHLFGLVDDKLVERISLQIRDDILKLSADIFDHSGVKAVHHVLEGSVLESCNSLAETLDASLLILGAHGSGFRYHWLLGTTAERLLSKTLRPVLVVKTEPRSEYRKVLVPVDFSSWSEGAIRLALKVAPDAEFILMHAYEVPFESKLHFAGVEEEVIQQHLFRVHQEGLQRLSQLATKSGLDPDKWESVVIHGDASSRILEQGEQPDIDLIVLGKHGIGMTEELLLGSVTRYVLSQTGNDVLVAYR